MDILPGAIPISARFPFGSASSFRVANLGGLERLVWLIVPHVLQYPPGTIRQFLHDV
jgi:hypothetical protein